VLPLRHLRHHRRQVQLDDEWSIRMMGSRYRKDGTLEKLPYALVMDRLARGEMAQDFSDKTRALTAPPRDPHAGPACAPGEGPSFVPAR
jgi:hypothetical protein